VKFDHFLAHLQRTQVTRRQAIERAAQLGIVAGALASAPVTASPAEAQGGGLPPEPLTDAMFDVAAVERGAWAPGPYGAGDQRGAFNEVTPQKTAAALALLNSSAPVVTYNLGELMVNGFPAFVTTPPRVYQQRLTASGYQPPADFEGFAGSPQPAGQAAGRALQPRRGRVAGRRLDGRHHPALP